VPKKVWLFPQDEPQRANVKPSSIVDTTNPKLSIYMAWTPYVLVALLLVLTRVNALPLKALLAKVKIEFTHILVTKISNSISPLYLSALSPSFCIE
jgi:lactate permease